MNSMARRIEDQFFYKMDQELLREQKALMQMEKTKKEIEERRKSKDFVSHEEVKKRFGL